MNYKEIIKRHLEDYGSITSMEAFSEYGITRLSAVVFNLRKDGMDIETHTVTSRNRYGAPCSFAKYTLR